MSLFGLAVAPDENARERLAPGSLVTVAFLRALPNPRQHFHARLEIGFCDISQQFVTKFVGSCIDLHNYPLGAPTEQHHFAAAIVCGIRPRDPRLLLQSMQ